jgi:transposase, IS5 family
MRKTFDPQLRLDCPDVANVRLNVDCRHEIIPILRALQHIYDTPEVREAIFAAIARDVNRTSDPRLGRPGMTYWEITVLAAARLGCNCDYDELSDLAQNHRTLRRIMGIGDWDEERDAKKFDFRRIESNLNLLSPKTIEEINAVIVAEGQRLAPKAAQTVRADSFVAETNVHYPTDSSLIRDGVRKIIAVAVVLAGMFGLDGWRQHQHLYRKVRKLARNIDRVARGKRPDRQQRLKALYRELLTIAGTVCGRARTLLQEIQRNGCLTPEAMALEAELEMFLQRTLQVCDTARRRVLLDEHVPNGEKLFSIFEPHTQLYKRGKAGQEVQFGRLVLIYEDGAGFVSHYSILPRDKGDRDVAVEETRKAQERHGGRIRRGSFDRGFHSPENQEQLAKILAEPCLPMPGAKQASEQNRTASVQFRQGRQSHPGVESAIHALQSGNGLKRCRDRSERGFERYIGLGVLGRNLHVLGKLLIARESPDSAASSSKRKSAA